MTVEQAEVCYPATLGSLRELHDWVCDLLQRAAAGRSGGLPADWVHSVEAATAELASNIVRHAYRDTNGELRCRIVLYGDRVEVSFFDRGARYVPRPVTMPNPEELQESGYGLFLIQELTDTVEYTRSADGENRWLLTKDLPPAPAASPAS